MTTATAPSEGTSASRVTRPVTERGTLIWLRKNLFRTPFDTALTVILVIVGGSLLIQFFEWSISQADWTVITVNFRILMQGTYPADQGTRLGLSVALITLIAGVSWGIWGKLFRSTAFAFVGGVLIFVFIPLAAESLPELSESAFGNYLSSQLAPLFSLLRDPVLLLVACLLIGYGIGRFAKQINRKRAARYTLIAWFIAIPVCFILVRGFTDADGILPFVQTNRWGGLLLTFMLAFVAIVACFPLGILLALGRMSGSTHKLTFKAPPRWWLNPLQWLHALSIWWRNLGNYPIIKLLCIVYIEFLRGVPLVTVFFTANLIVPLALGDNSIDAVLRAMVALTLFEAAYIAEIVRGGLQALPPGQLEAAKALGLSPVQATLFITLPQALRIAIPPLVGQFITMFKDTSLVAIIGLTELLGISRSVLAQSEFIGKHREVYIFIAIVYFVFSYGMSYAARQLERSGSGAIRKIG
ncbi:MAG: amino acid ABC transporter permease [Candidatus Thermofonsia Clade 1 bacterium]|uniref:Amino acid ABC transporter permease n=1 Tax=Candidatus Thermofonsia Clade 1 bacterium TaxID=2364210 RepID=A0A2M8P3G3_9CHLR|nr:MAG: amino acid ABC transporter permease [Candidatus Thermofonsia Clade 1 bacterium]